MAILEQHSQEDHDQGGHRADGHGEKLELFWLHAFPPFFAFPFAQRAAAPSEAISRRRLAESFLARAGPPALPPFFPNSDNSPGCASAALRLPRATAAAFFVAIY
jgi:hypothetical protein